MRSEEYIDAPVAVPPPVPTWNIANIITLFRIILVPVFVWALLAAGWNPIQSLTLRWVAFGIFLLAALSDKLDGHLARSRGLITDLGKLLDPIADKALMGAAFIFLAFPLLEIPWWVPVVILIRELGITLMRMRLRRYSVLPAGRGGKAKTFIQSIAIALLLLPLARLPHWVMIVAWVFLAAAIILTVLSGIDYALNGWDLRKRALAENVRL
ncbi:MAG: CDP-diacylglycerol--glycerol-3-phosphate 3-phosphatidyltransferase [Cellulomonadaceae bacterium]|jgi:CDP-diacylglycerol--glycerol-3-phosphate 3-phosphatidyltransferase|nr:CDP-diacylglycerol--glycerol-3-phosphate 3-phosphatidyltransferase [Cellulomonadaceae bacterium]